MTGMDILWGIRDYTLHREPFAHGLAENKV